MTVGPYTAIMEPMTHPATTALRVDAAILRRLIAKNATAQECLFAAGVVADDLDLIAEELEHPQPAQKAEVWTEADLSDLRYEHLREAEQH